MLNDLLIATKIKEGDISAFETLFKQYYAPLCLYSASIIGSHESAEEIVEELFYKLWKNRKKISIFHSIKSYLYAAIKNQSLQFIEHLKVKEKYTLSRSAYNDTNKCNDPLTQIEYKELETIINKTLKRIPQRRMLIFNMHRIEGRKYSEIAQTLSISIKTVESEMTRTLKVLRNEIEQYTR